MSWPYEDYVTLLTDLLSPGELHRGTLAAITKQLATVEDAGLARLISAMLQSPSLFGLQPAHQASTSTQRLSNVNLEAAQDVFHAVRQGVLSRIQEANKLKGYKWSKRRKLRKSITVLHDSLLISMEGDNSSEILKHLSIASAVLRGFQDAATDKDPSMHPETSLLDTCERVAIKTILLAAKSLSSSSPSDLPDDHSLLVAWHVAQVVPDIPSDHLTPLAEPPFFDFGFSYIRHCFMNGHILDGLSADVRDNPEGIEWPNDSATSLRLKTAKASLAHALLGRFSRSLGKVVESVGSRDRLLLLLPHLEQLESMAELIHRAWAACTWSNVSGPEDLHPNTRSRDEPWSIFKTLLFTLTMIFSSLMSLMNAMPISSTHSPDKIILDLASCAIRTFSSIYFVTSKFGTSGFGAYQNVWYGAVDLVSRAQPQKVEQIVKTCEPHYEHAQSRDTLISRSLPRSRLTYWLTLVEQLALPLPDDYLSVTVLPALRPYLKQKQDPEAFESAHSVLLAIFNTRKSISAAVASQYTDLLLKSYPDLLSISQLRLAFASMIACLTDLDSEEVDVCMAKLINAIELKAPGPSLSTTGEVPLADVSVSGIEVKSSQKGPARPDISPKALEAAAVKSRRGHLLLVLIDQLSTVTLEKMEDLLPTVQAFLNEEKRASAESRVAMVQVLFNTLSGGMDMIKRESAAKWWLEHRAEIEQGELFAEVKKDDDKPEPSTPVSQQSRL
ncbi:hypothetical protein P389DRAFT_174721 [Cystobasidium minutum MCA 4210]|uniref:uncharacterized protein n=1 Tax=Cystobasidium minutum MCA 4210 TaxID=1397322 RepID=UPI0034CFACB3|eukprot:jgi/Rhomi1/174721/fgenesh1_kg.8_\